VFKAFLFVLKCSSDAVDLSLHNLQIFLQNLFLLEVGLNFLLQLAHNLVLTLVVLAFLLGNLNQLRYLSLQFLPLGTLAFPLTLKLSKFLNISVLLFLQS
jgi:threonine/homoserine efflux transporter RhtA